MKKFLVFLFLFTSFLAQTNLVFASSYFDTVLNYITGGTIFTPIKNAFVD